MDKVSRIAGTVLTFLFLIVVASPAVAKEKTKKVDFDFVKTSAFMREMDSRPDFPVSVVLANDYVYSLLAIGDTIAPAKKSALIAYLKKAQQKDGGFVPEHTNKSSSLLFTDIAIETLGYLHALDAIDAGKAKAYVGSLKNADGGFGFSKEAKASSLATTCYAVRILKALDGLELVDKQKTMEFAKGFERKDGGFGYVKGVGVANAKNTYMAAFTLNTLGKLDNATRSNALKFLAATPYVDKKSKASKELDEQLYAVKALKELQAGDKIDKSLAVAYLKRIYIPLNGGFGPLEGYGSTPDSTTTGIRILVENGKLKTPPFYALAKK